MFRLRASAEDLFGPLPGAMLRELRMPWLKALGIRTVLDVGANVGQFASLARAAFPTARIVSFEPLPDCHARLQRRFRNDGRFQAMQIALGSKAETREFQRSSYSPSSSLLQMTDQHRDAFRATAATTPVSVEVRRLDDALDGLSVEDPLLLKLDVQGFELEVLRGAARTLERCSLVLLEASLQKSLYVGEALFADLFGYLGERGFALAGIVGGLRDPRDGRPLQVDALFERPAR